MMSAPGGGGEDKGVRPEEGEEPSQHTRGKDPPLLITTVLYRDWASLLTQIPSKLIHPSDSPLTLNRFFCLSSVRSGTW